MAMKMLRWLQIDFKYASKQATIVEATKDGTDDGDATTLFLADLQEPSYFSFISNILLYVYKKCSFALKTLSVNLLHTCW